MRIYDILPVGEENAIPGEEIGRRLGITRRERRAMAAQELKNGLFVLYTATLPGGYLRPAEGEKRISNYLLWQIAYSEILVTDEYWPEFGRDSLAEAVEEFKNRQRRFGK